MDTTLPNDTTAHQGPSAVPKACWSLTVAHHREPQHIGRRMVVFDGATVVLGRGERCFGADVFDDGRISRKHAEIAADDESTLWVSDGSSRNGTFVNGRRIDKCELRRGDVVRVGKLLLVAQHGPPVVHRPAVGALVGVGHAFAQVCDRIDKVAERETTVVLSGGPGSGKTALARLLHERSGRAGGFVPVHCGSLSQSDIHSELFGHVAGAFAGASDGRGGLIEAAHDGTVLFESIHTAPDKLQLALLEFLEHGVVRKLGADEAHALDVRVVASCDRALESYVDAGSLRRELVDRLAAWHVAVPSLSERVEDIGVLARCFAERFAGPEAVLDRRLVLHLLRRQWPGNVRELEAFIERAAVQAEGGHTLRLPAELGAGDGGAAATPDVVQVAGDGSWFCATQSERVDLTKRKALRRMLAALLHEREHAPGTALSVADLLAAGWPGERPSADSGANRVYVALTTLRRLGLRQLVERTKAGYVIPAAAPLRVVDAAQTMPPKSQR